MTRRQALRRAVFGLLNRRQEVDDPNFIGFDKYRLHGSYHWRELANNAEYRRKIELLADLVEADGHCLDLGCGDGAYLYVLAKRCREAVGVDADSAAVGIANRELKRAGVTNARCLNLPLSAVRADTVGHSTFDLVYSMDVLEHLPEPRELLQVAVRMSRPDGVVAIGTPLFIRQELVSEYHVKEYTRRELEDLMGEHLDVDRVVVLPDRRRDGRMYDESFFVAIGTPRQ